MGANADTYLTVPTDDSTGVGAALAAPRGVVAKTDRRVGDARPAKDDAARPRFQAVLCDVEDVLYEASSWYRWLGRIFARLGIDLEACSFAQLWRSDYLPMIQRGDEEFFTGFAACLAAGGFAPAACEEIVAAARAERRRQQASLRPLPGVRATLHRLKATGIQLGVLANIDRSAAALAKDLGRLGLDGLFTSMLTSLDMRKCLPAAGCYGQAVAAIGSPTNEILFVGRDARELLGARLAGLAVAAVHAQQCAGDVTQLDRFDCLLELVIPAGTSWPRVAQSV